jgi:hypothetical protein
MAFMITRGQVGDFEKWKAMFDADPPRAREHATGYRVMRALDEPGVVAVEVEFPSDEAAREGRRRLVESGVLERLGGVVGPTIVEQVDAAGAATRERGQTAL